MIRGRWWNPRIRLIPICLAAWALHAVMKQWLAHYDIVSVIFAAGDHVPGWMLALAALFVMLRLFVWLAVPGLLAGSLILWVGKRALGGSIR